jgi:hypothetical protein
MKHLPVLLIALLWLPFVAFSQEPLITEKKLTTEVSAVTVYFSGAQIGRKTDVPLKKGKYRLILTGLEADIVEQSLQVDASGLQISSVSVRSNFIDNPKKQECLYSITQTPDGGLVVAGNNSYFDFEVENDFKGDANYMVKLKSDCALQQAYNFQNDAILVDETWDYSRKVRGGGACS